MSEKWRYQKNDTDCWICAIENGLLYKECKVSDDTIYNILNERKLPIFNNMIFFTYIPLILLDLGFPSDVFFPKNTALLQSIRCFDKINMDCLLYIMRFYRSKKNLIFYFYKALYDIMKIDNINVKLCSVDYYNCTTKGKVIIANVMSENYYGLKSDRTKHAVTVVSEGLNSSQVIDPYKYRGEREIRNWHKYLKYSEKFDWCGEYEAVLF